MFENQPEESLLNASDKQRVQATTGSLIYLAHVTRCDIFYSVIQLAREGLKQSNAHMRAAKHVNRNLAGTTNSSITYTKRSFTVTEFSDVN